MTCLACYNEFPQGDSICSDCVTSLLADEDGTEGRCVICSCRMAGPGDFLCQPCCEEKGIVALSRLIPTEPSFSHEQQIDDVTGYARPTGNLRVSLMGGTPTVITAAHRAAAVRRSERQPAFLCRCANDGPGARFSDSSAYQPPHLWLYKGSCYVALESVSERQMADSIRANRGWLKAQARVQRLRWAERADEVIARAQQVIDTRRRHDGLWRLAPRPAEEATATEGTAAAKEIRLAVWKRDDGRCVKCGSRDGVGFDRLVSPLIGGRDTEGNLRLLCADCSRP